MAALKGDKTAHERARQFGVPPTPLHDWKRRLLAGAETAFANGVKAATGDPEAEEAELCEQLGRLKMELGRPKKKSDRSPEQLRLLSVRRQCQLLGLCRPSLYYQSVAASAENLRRMRPIDREDTARPLLGSRRLTKWLTEQCEAVNRKRVRRRMRLMGLEAIYPKPRLGAAGRGHRVYPYLLRNGSIERPGQGWSTGITSVPPANGSLYLAATLDWFSRPGTAWRLSNALGGSFCLEMLEGALSRGRPELFHADQGVRFTAAAWAGRLEAAGGGEHGGARPLRG